MANTRCLYLHPRLPGGAAPAAPADRLAQAGAALEILVLDNASSDGTSTIVRRRPIRRVRLVRNDTVLSLPDPSVVALVANRRHLVNDDGAVSTVWSQVVSPRRSDRER